MIDLANAGKGLTLYGIIAMILGFLCMLAPLMTGIAVAMMVGVLVLAGGILRVIWAFQAGSVGKGLLRVTFGGLTVLCGIMLLANPLLAAGLLTIMLSVYLFVDGISEIAAGLQGKPEPGWGLFVFAGIASILLGLMIWKQFPLSGPFAIGILLGIKLFLAGMIMLTVGSKVTKAA